jgi:hypothetical protein
MKRNDVDALDALLHPDLLFTHANGRRQNKATYLDDFRTGALWFADVRHEADVVREVDDLAVVVGWMTAEVRFHGRTRRLDSHTVAVWAKDHGQWRLLAYQSSPRPAASLDRARSQTDRS